MEIQDVVGNGKPLPVRRGGGGRGQRATQASRQGDTVEISAAARQAAWVAGLVARVRDMPEVRPAVVDAARAALARGELDSPAAVQAAASAIARGR